jgi:3-hydroxyisobutyrate dehydrogenase
MSRISFLGLGAMGQRMARRLIEAGHDLTVWNRSPGPTEAFTAAGARAAATPREAAEGAQIVWSMVYDDTASRQVWLDPVHGAASALAADAIAVESSTLSPAWIGELHAALSARGQALIDAPVSGSRLQADAGQLIFLVGGDKPRLDALRPALAALAGAVHHVGPSGSGAWLKLAVNALFATQVVAMAELLSLLRHAGLDLPRTFDALRTLPVTSPAAAGSAALMLAGNFSPMASVDLIAKDLGYVIGSAANGHTTLPLTAAVRLRLQQTHDAGFGQENVVAVAKLYS